MYTAQCVRTYPDGNFRIIITDQPARRAFVVALLDKLSSLKAYGVARRIEYSADQFSVVIPEQFAREWFGLPDEEDAAREGDGGDGPGDEEGQEAPASLSAV